MRRMNITGDRYERLVAVERQTNGLWLFRCDCGSEIIRSIGQVRCGNTKSCGCLNRDRIVERNTKHGGTQRGKARHPLYNLWAGMKARCSDPNHIAFKNYGAKGIKVCERWLDFQNFVEGMGPRPSGTSIDRIKTDGDYEPENCRWATRREQQENTSRNRYLEVHGERLTVSQWARKLGVDQRILNRRRALGWSDQDVILKPIGERHASARGL